ncbi:hypothetical protein ACOME3_002433 [Neoechinorhynchus agilis]
MPRSQKRAIVTFESIMQPVKKIICVDNERNQDGFLNRIRIIQEAFRKHDVHEEERLASEIARTAAKITPKLLSGLSRAIENCQKEHLENIRVIINSKSKK